MGIWRDVELRLSKRAITVFPLVSVLPTVSDSCFDVGRVNCTASLKVDSQLQLYTNSFEESTSAKAKAEAAGWLGKDRKKDLADTYTHSTVGHAKPVVLTLPASPFKDQIAPKSKSGSGSGSGRSGLESGGEDLHLRIQVSNHNSTTTTYQALDQVR